jgi:hypothetical protein
MAAFHPMTGRANVICAGFVRTQLVDNVRLKVGVARRSGKRTDNPCAIPL